MHTRSRPADGALSPGTDPAALRLITVAVLVGLIISGVAAVTAGGQTPAASVTAGVPGRQGARMPMAARSRQAAGVKLLNAAAGACHSVAYEGVEVLRWRGPGGTSTSVLDVWHQQNGQTLAKVASPPPDLTQPPGPALFEMGDRTSGLDGNGILGMDARLVALIGANYSLAVTGHGEVVGRQARVVTVRRGNGSIAARFWLDSVTGLPLRRQMFDTRARLVSNVAFTRLTLARGALPGVPTPGAQPWGHRLATAQLTKLRAQGWPLPGAMPDGLTLLSAKEDSTDSETVIELDYSDGLSVVSVFMQRGYLPSDMHGWSEVRLAGHLVYTDDPADLSAIWSAHGFVYTVIAAAPQQTVGEVVAALPHDGGPGLFGRIKRGMRRLFSWADP